MEGVESEEHSTTNSMIIEHRLRRKKEEKISMDSLIIKKKITDILVMTLPLFQIMQIAAMRVLVMQCRLEVIFLAMTQNTKIIFEYAFLAMINDRGDYSKILRSPLISNDVTYA